MQRIAGNSSVAVVVLTYNRPHLIPQRVRELSQLGPAVREIFIVDNDSQVPASSVCDGSDPRVRFIRTEQNLGAVARNRAFAVVTADIVVCLDDDVYGLDDAAVATLVAKFAQPDLGAVNFRVADGSTRGPINWCHHYDVDTHWRQAFVTNEITEGAVAFARIPLQAVGGYPESFFISHEGPDMAFRLLNRGYAVVYDPDVIVYHEPEQAGRVSWRRYYYDVRNLFWLAARNYPLLYALRKIVVQAGALLVYAIRDGYARYWLRGVLHGLRGLPSALRERERPKPATMRLIRQIEANRPPLAKLLRRRLFRKGVQI